MIPADCTGLFAHRHLCCRLFQTLRCIIKVTVSKRQSQQQDSIPAELAAESHVRLTLTLYLTSVSQPMCQRPGQISDISIATLYKVEVHAVSYAPKACCGVTNFQQNMAAKFNMPGLHRSGRFPLDGRFWHRPVPVLLAGYEFFIAS